ncbi:MAG: permease [Acidobacteria bacterium]|nr:MAG: permease [Acidobacteriota bacterium]
MATLLQDLRYGLRMLTKDPGFTAMAVLTLALGIGANTAMFSVANAVLLEPLPYKRAGRLVTLWWTNTAFGSSAPGSVCDPDYVQWRTQNQVFEDMAAFHGMTSNLTGVGEPERLLGSAVSPNIFHLLGVSPLLGRTFLPEEERAEHGNVVLLSRQLWERRFGSDPALAGKSITLDGTSFAVVGVMPANFRFPNESSFWEPLVLSHDCSNAMDQVVARLKPGITLERARNDVAVIEHRLNQQRRRADTGQPTFSFVFLRDAMVSNIRPALLVLMAAVGLVLLIACANVVNMLLARATARQREMAIRSALGAGRGRILRQLLTESALLAVAGGSLAVIFAAWCRDSLVSLMPQNLALPGVISSRIAAVNIDARVLGFTLLASLGSGLLLGLAAALQASRADTNLSLKESASTSTPGIRLLSLRNLLVIGEFALTLVLLASAGLLMKSFVRLIELDPGIQPLNVLTMNLVLPSTKYQTETQMKAFHDAVMQKMGALPGVRAVGTVSYGLPLGGGGLLGDFEVDGQREMSAHLMASKLVVSPGYFRALGIPLLQGRSFDDHDSAQAQPVAIVSDSVARRFWPKGDAPGKRISLGWQGSPWYSVVGVARDVRQMGPQKEAPLAIYVPYSQAPRDFFLSFMTVVARTDSDPLSMANTLRRAVQTVDPDIPLFNVASMEQLVYKSVASPRFNALLLACFAALALTLAVVGIYGVMSYSVAQRTHEIGIRIALGAQQEDVLKLVVSQGLRLTLIGEVAGILGALGLTRFLSSLLYSVKPSDPLTFVVVSLGLAGVALLASYVPARRATKVDPMAALRYE